MAPLDYRSRAVTLDDIVFEDRNRRYGAYWLRTHYNEHVLHGLLWAGLAFTLVLVGPMVYNILLPAEVVVPDKEVVLYILPPPPSFQPVLPPVPALPPPSLKSAAASTEFLVPEIITTPEEIKVPTMKELEKSIPGASTSDGDSNASLFDGNTIGVPNGKDIVLDQLAAPQGDFTIVEQMPEAKYNILSFIGKNTVYPPEDIRNEVSGMVTVDFRIAPDGSIEDAYIRKGISPTCDAEALRVVLSMPKWEPGKQNGKPVPVRMTMPVRFKLN